MSVSKNVNLSDVKPQKIWFEYHNNTIYFGCPSRTKITSRDACFAILPLAAYRKLTKELRERRRSSPLKLTVRTSAKRKKK